MDVTLVLLSLTALIIFFIVVLVLSKPDKEISDKIFIVFNVAMISWIISDIFYSTSDNYAFFWANLTYISALFLPVLYLYFSLTFLSRKVISKKKIFLLLLVPGVILLFLLFRPGLMIRNDQIPFSFGPIYFFYILYMIVYFLSGHIVFFKKSRTFSGVEKRQIDFILYGSLVSSVLALIGALFLPLLKIYVLYFFSPVFVFILPLFITYAIFKHSLFDVKVVTTEIFSALIVLILLVSTLVSETKAEFLLRMSILISVAIFSSLLIRSVLNEVRSREKIAEMAKSLKKANIELKQLDKAKSEFISLASHQLRTPLSIVKGYVSMMVEGTWGGMTEKQKEQLDKIYISNEQLIRLVEDLLTVSRIESGRLEFDYKMISLDNLVDAIVKEFSQIADKKNIYLKYIKPAKPLPQIKIDSLKIRQVIQNLIDNAISYTKKGGATVNLKKEGNKLVFSIKDTGVGVLPEDQVTLFDKFSRGKGIGKIRNEGMGLGLYLAAKMIKAHHGEIWVTSEGKDKGSTFYFELPIKEIKKEREKYV